METIANPHTPEEMAQLSTFVHNLIGWLLLALAATLLAETVRGVPKSRWRYAWPGLGAFIGFGLLLFVLLDVTLRHKVGPLAIPVQVQHQLIGLVVGLGSTAELVRRARGMTSRSWASAWPVTLVAIGVVFLLHEQGTTEALLVHWALAATLILAGLMQLAVALSGEEARSMRVLAVLVLAAAAVQLVVFDENPGAHAGHRPPPSAESAGEHKGH